MHNDAVTISPARKLDDKGRCCGRKPLVYKRERKRFCPHCNRAYGLETGDQIPNWAWLAVEGGFVPKYPESEYCEGDRA